MRTIATVAAVLAAAFWLGGCSEVTQEAGKEYAGTLDTKPYAGDPFKGDKAKWEGALAERNQKMNDYARMPVDKK